MLKKLLLLSSVLAIPVAALTISARAAPSPAAQCHLAVAAIPGRLKGFYTARITLMPGAKVQRVQTRLESYVGGAYPRKSWFQVTREHPLDRSGAPWYWRVACKRPDGVVVRFALPNTEAP